MSELMLVEPVELSDAELDLVTGGLAVAAGGLVNVPINISQNDVNLLNNADILNVSVGSITLKDIASNNQVAVGAVIQALGGGAAILQSV
jgi:hypothetical protein